jgi:hypothetical protein
MYVLNVSGWDHFDAREVGFKELYQMYQLITEQLGQEAIVVDADDLLKYPGKCHGGSLQIDSPLHLRTINDPNGIGVFKQHLSA